MWRFGLMRLHRPLPIVLALTASAGLAVLVHRAGAPTPDAADFVPAVVVSVGTAAGSVAGSMAESVANRVTRDITLVSDTIRVAGLIPQRTTLDTLLRGHGVADDAAVGVVQAAGHVFDPRRLRSLQPFSIERTLEGALRLFEYRIDADTALRVVSAARGAARWTAEIVPVPKTTEHIVAAGHIDRDTPSLFQAMDAAGEGDQLAVDLAGIFAGEVDFNSDLQPGDDFSLAFERHTRVGGPTTYGTITAAEFRNDGRVLRAIRFAPPGQPAAYFDENGQSLRRFFLRSPLKFEPRVTSRFSSNRRHPVLHTNRAHRGIDYAAPVGAPVIAAAGGVLVSMTTDRANGRMVRVRHASGYESHYLHLSAFVRGLRAGVHVGQGDTIGYVGSSGLATGPHLHYGLLKNGTYVNPMEEQRKLPPVEPLPPAAMALFQATRDQALAQLAEAPSRDRSAAAGAAP
jgi:murein DD-endopeptidase MepM/ murein hydrolase activator NlpD